MATLSWITNWDEAFKQAARRGTPVLVYFQLPECIGCRLMAAETFPDPELTNTIAAHVAPLMIHADALPQSEDFCVRWTPHLAMCHRDGRLLQAAEGYQPPAELTPWIGLGLARHAMVERDWLGALKHLERVISLHPKSAAAAEAVFLRGVAGFRQSKDPLHLKNAYRKLSEEYPASVWLGRARPYRAL